jgi:hypothetical protein
MNWINSGHFQIADRNNRHYVFRRTNAGNTEINIPKNVVTKGRAKAWLKANPNKVKNPTSFKAKRSPLKGVQAPGLRPFERIINGKKMIAIATKNGKTRYSPVRTGAVRGLVLPAAPKANRNYKCNTQFYKRVRNSNGKTGFNASLNMNMKISNTLTLKRLYTVTNRRIPVTKGLGKLGKGTQGRVFLAYTTPEGQWPVTIKVIPHDKEHRKQTADIEFGIQQKLHKIIPGSIPAPYKILHDCKEFIPASSWAGNKKTNLFNYKDQTVTFTEFIDGGSLPNWMNRMNAKLDDDFMQNLISQVLHILAFIQKRMPSFRHNDLHLDNILVKQNPNGKYPAYVLNDFGWASIGPKTNPLVNGAKHAETFGIGPITSSRYDMHLFLNELHKWLQTHGGRAKYPKAFAFIEKYVPDGYRGSTNKHIRESRLKYGDKASGLPSLRDIVRDPYVKAPKNLLNNTNSIFILRRKMNKLTKNNLEKLLKSNSVTPRKLALAQKTKNIRNNAIKNPTWMSPVYVPTSSQKRMPNLNMLNMYNPNAPGYMGPGKPPNAWKQQNNALLKMRKRTPSPATPANNGGSKRRKTSSRKKVAKSVGRNRTSPKKINFSPYKNMKLSPRSFLKLTPRSRAAYMVKARGNTTTRPVLVKNVARTRGAPVERETFRMVPVPRTYLKVAGPGRNMRTVAKNSPARWAARKIVNEAIRKAIAANKKPSPPKPLRLRTPTPPRRNSPRKPPTPPSPRLASIMERSKKANRRSKYRTTYTPKTGRMKIEGNKGRLSYVNGTGVSLDYLKQIARTYGVNITGLRSKVSIANKIFRNNK